MMKIEPAAMTVPAGVPVTFVVTNTGTVLHEFTLGDAADQEAHDKEMMEAGGMSMPKDEENAIGVEPGKTKELTYTFDAAGEDAGRLPCHRPLRGGHEGRDHDRVGTRHLPVATDRDACAFAVQARLGPVAVGRSTLTSASRDVVRIR